MGQNHSLAVYVSYLHLPIVRAECPDSDSTSFYYEIITNLPYNANEILRFLKYVQKLFFEKFGKNGKFAVEWV